MKQIIKETVADAAHAGTPPRDTHTIRVSIVMLTFNRVDVTQQAIASLRASTQQPYELILVDNASSDGTLAYLDSLEGDGVRVIRNDTNRGVAAGWNQGLRSASGDCLMVLNNDVLVAGDWLERMVRVAYQVPRAGIVGCRTNFAGGPQVLEPAYADVRDFPLFAQRHAAMAAASWFELPRVVAVAALWRRDVYERVGEFDERFSPANFEDDDYCLRTVAAGYRNLVANDVYIHHIGHASQAANDMEPDALLLQNRTRFLEKWGEAAAPITATQWNSYAQHIALLAPEQYALPAWAVPSIPAAALAEHLARAGRRLHRLGWRAAAQAAFRRSLRTAVTPRGITGVLWTALGLPRRR